MPDTSKRAGVDKTSFDLIGPLYKRSWFSTCFEEYDLSSYYDENCINVILDFVPMGFQYLKNLKYDILWYDLIDNFEKHTIDDRPVVFIFSSAKLNIDAAASGTTTQALLEDAKSLVKASGFEGIYFIAGQTGGIWTGFKDASAEGYSAVSAYNYHPADGKAGFENLNTTYEYQWDRLAQQPMPVILPMTSGWDRSPLGGSKWDDSIATAAQFKRHLIAGRDFAKEHGYNYGVICCWNEFGEGSYIEPTKKNRFKIISQIKRVFSK